MVAVAGVSKRDYFFVEHSVYQNGSADGWQVMRISRGTKKTLLESVHETWTGALVAMDKLRKGQK